MNTIRQRTSAPPQYPFPHCQSGLSAFSGPLRGLFRHSKRISALSCSIVFFSVLQQVPQQGPLHARQQKKAPNESGLSQHIASATAKHYLDFALEVDFFCATEVLFFCEERFWATCFFEEGFLLLATEVLLAAFFEATVVRFLLETALCFELDRLDESVCLPFFCDLETTCLALLCESAASEAVR